MNKEQWGSHDCIHAKACRRLNKKAFAQLGRRVVMGCDKDTCTAYETKNNELYTFSRQALELAFARATDSSMDWGGSSVDDYIQGLYE